jgi:recombination protein RecA
MVYDASLVLRIERDGWITVGSKENKRVVGERHRVEVKKTKVAGKEGKTTTGYFHTSNGAVIPEGFDLASDVLELAILYGIISRSGAWYSYNGERIGNGESATVEYLTNHPEVLSAVESEVRFRFAPDEDLGDGEYDSETGEVE